MVIRTWVALILACMLFGCNSKQQCVECVGFDDGGQHAGGGLGGTGGGLATSGGGGGSTSGGGGGSMRAPSLLAYAANPITYRVGEEISANSPSNMGGTATHYDIEPTLPEGLMFDGATGVITGTPSVVAARANYTVTASNAVGATSVVLVITIVDRSPAQVTYTPNSILCQQDAPCMVDRPTVTGGAPTLFELTGTLPEGMRFDSATGAIAGTPTVGVAATSLFVTASNTGGSAGGSLTLEVAAHVSTCAQLESIRGGNSQRYELTNDIDCAGVAFRPIADFRGTLDGRGHLISNLTIDSAAEGGVGLIGDGTRCSLLNLGVVGAAITAHGSSSGILAGTLDSSRVVRCVVSGTVAQLDFVKSGWSSAGGLVGVATGSTIEDIMSNAVVSGATWVGGVVGLSLSEMNQPRSEYHRVSAISPYLDGQTIGSFAGHTDSKVSDSFAVASPTASFVGYGKANSTNNFGLEADEYASSPDAGSAAWRGAGSSANAPLSSWDFATVWQETTEYPTLRGATLANGWRSVFWYTPAIGRLSAGVPMQAMEPHVSPVAHLNGCTVTPSLPGGLTLNPSTCTIEGTPTVRGVTQAYAVVAQTDLGPLRTQILLTAPPPTNLKYDAEYTFNAFAPIAPTKPTHDGGEILECRATQALPPGLTLDNSCTISGTPTGRVEKYGYTIVAVGETGQTTTQVVIEVVDPRPVLTYVDSSLVANVAVFIKPTQNFNVAAAAITPLLPPGLTFELSTGVIRGTPLATSSQTYTVSVQNAQGQTSSSTFRLAVVESQAPSSFSVVDAWADGTGAMVAVGVSSGRVLLQRFTADGVAREAPWFAFQVSGPKILSLRVTNSSGGIAVMAVLPNESQFTANHQVLVGSWDAALTARALMNFDAVDTYADLAIDDDGVVGVVVNTHLRLIDGAGVRAGFPIEITSIEPTGGVHLSMNGTNALIAYQQKSQVLFRRLSYSAANFQWADGAAVLVNSAGIGPDSSGAILQTNGAFAVWKTDTTSNRDEVYFYDSTAKLIAKHFFAMAPSFSVDTTRFRHVHFSTIGTDYVIPFHDPSNSSSQYFNSYARFTLAGSLKGTQSGGTYDTSTLMASSSSTWVVDGAQLVKNPFSLVP